MRYGGDSNRNSYGGDDDHEGGGRGDSIFTEESQIQGNDTLTLNGGAKTLFDVVTVGQRPHMLTVSWGVVGRDLVPSGPPPGSGEVVAALQIGIGGQLFTADIDMVRGQVLTLAASRLRLNARFVIPTGIPAPPPPPAAPPTVQVGASVTPGTVAHGLAPQRTLGSHVAIAPGGQVWYPVPLFAKAFRFIGNSSPGSMALVADISVADANGNLLEFYEAVSGAPSSEILLPNGSEAVVVAVPAVGAPAIAEHRLVFDLAL